ncbi:MAG: DNA cytosine methyltransferase [Solirubrobacterales bacterium]
MSGVDFHDQFCGGGGSSLGAVRAGARPVIGMNHSPVACETYLANHAQHGAEVACCDVTTTNPRRFRKATMLLTSPECTHHSYARGRPKDDPSLFDPHGDKEAERSRATMWDVPNFAEHHGYEAIIVENVEQAVKWGLPRGRKLKQGDYGPLFAAWLNAMVALGYDFQLVHLNAMVCGVPQSRDRLFVVFWRKGGRRPDLEINGFGFCPSCEKLGEGRQTWKKPNATTGAYGSQYFYACLVCGDRIWLAVRPAADAIDWDLENPRIGDRDKPLAPATIQRIEKGLRKLANRPMVVPITHADGSQRARLTGVPLPTLTAFQEQSLVVQVGGHAFERPGYARAWQTDEPFRTLATGADKALIVSNMNNNAPRPAVDEAMHTVTTGSKLYLLAPPEAAVIAHRSSGASADAGKDPMPAQTTINSLYLLDTARRGMTPTPPGETPLSTILTRGAHHGLVVAHYGSKDAAYQGHARHADDDPMGTIKSRDGQSLVEYDPESIAVEDCGFRMLQPHELQRGQDFDAGYDFRGTKRQKVAQIGNAVPAAAEETLVRRVMASLEPAGS